MPEPDAFALSAAEAAKNPITSLLRDLIQERTGVYFEDDRLEVMAEKVLPRAAAHRCASLLDYYYVLKYEKSAPDEWRALMDAFSVQETYFWREFDQINYLVNTIVPEWFRTSSLPLRIWSAACATGEEPYTIAIALKEAGWAHHPIEIIASDGSDTALGKARTALYRERSFRALSPELRAKYFTAKQDAFELDQAIRDRVSFRWANLVDPETFKNVGNLPVVFCRNVFIYFSTTTISRVVASFSRHMDPGSHLFVGASESLLKLTDHYELKEIPNAFTYVRRTPDPS